MADYNWTDTTADLADGDYSSASARILIRFSGAPATPREVPMSRIVSRDASGYITGLNVRGAAAANGMTIPSTSTANIMSTEAAANGVGPVLALSGRYAGANTATFATIKGALAGAGDGNSAAGFLTIALGNAAAAQVERLRLENDGTLRAGVDNIQALGSGAVRWSGIYLGSSPTVTSDARDKANIAAIDDAVVDAWAGVEWRRFTMGDTASAGVIAQQVLSAFEDAGLDAIELGIVKRVAFDAPLEDGRHDRLFVDYTTAFAIEAAWQRCEIARLEAKLKAVEAR